MFERFTERARQVVVLAQEEARSMKHDFIGSGHLLLGLLREEEGLGCRALEQFDITVEKEREALLKEPGYEKGEVAKSGQIPFTDNAKKSMELALREALSLGHNYISTEHLLLGLIRIGQGTGIKLITDNGVKPEDVRNEIIRMLSGRGSRRHSPEAPQVKDRYTLKLTEEELDQLVAVIGDMPIKIDLGNVYRKLLALQGGKLKSA